MRLASKNTFTPHIKEKHMHQIETSKDHQALGPPQFRFFFFRFFFWLVVGAFFVLESGSTGAYKGGKKKRV